MIFSHVNVESKYEAITTSITKPTSTVIAIPNSSWDFYGYCGQTNHGHGSCLFLPSSQPFVFKTPFKIPTMSIPW